MSVPKHAVQVEISVPFHHCDPLNVVWHGRYFEYFEVARTALMRSIGLDVEEVKALGYKLFIVDARCRFMRPLVYGDAAQCTAWFLRPSPHVRIAYNLHTEGKRVARAVMALATTDLAGALLTEVPHEFLERLPDVD